MVECLAPHIRPDQLVCRILSARIAHTRAGLYQGLPSIHMSCRDANTVYKLVQQVYLIDEYQGLRMAR